MNRRLLRGGIAIAAACMLQAALADKNDSPVITPFIILQRPDRLNDCHSESGGDLGRNVERKVELTIAMDGSIKAFTLPEGSPEWMKDLSGCALNQFRFSPATRDGEPVETNASLTIRFRVRGPDQSTGVSIENVGPLIIPPRIRAKGGDINTCLTADNPRPGSVSRFIATYTVLPDGSVQDLVLPPGSERSQEEIARCILNRAKFLPGTRDGVPVAAEVKMPIVLRADGSDEGAFITPTLRSTDEEVEAAYRACYPPELLTMAAAIYKFNVSTNGHVSNPKVVKGSGDPRIDDAGVCIMKMLEFSPLIQNGRAVKSYVTWELPIRPHR